MKEVSSTEQIDQDIATLVQGDVRTWARIGLLLEHVEKSGYWKNSSESFSEWLRTFGPSVNLKEASLWRYFTAARYYVQLRHTLLGKDISCPALFELPDNVSPENLELLSKLARVVPDDVLQNLAQQVVTGKVTRADLREKWQAYRTVLGGRTSRGKGVPIPRIDKADPQQFDSLLEAQVITALSMGGGEWIGIKHPHLYELLRNVRVESSEKFIFDAVAILRRKKTDPLEFHGIEITGHYYNTNQMMTLQRNLSYCDYLWLAFHEHSSRIFEGFKPVHIGLIVVDDNGVRVLRHAKRTDESGIHSGDLAKGLLLKALHS